MALDKEKIMPLVVFWVIIAAVIFFIWDTISGVFR
jgi:RsiW-degrading membrane proteinase PrsW (M82 family)